MSDPSSGSGRTPHLPVLRRTFCGRTAVAFAKSRRAAGAVLILAWVSGPPCVPRCLAPDSLATYQRVGSSLVSMTGRLFTLPDVQARRLAAQELVDSISHDGTIPMTDSSVCFVYSGHARHVFVAGDFNEWNPSSDGLLRVQGTDLFVLNMSFPNATRAEYKFVVDSNWVLDPLNPRTAMGGFGKNSEICLPGYRPPPDVGFRTDIPHGSIDTINFKSRLLGCSHPVMIYTPPGPRSDTTMPVLYVTDGGEYLERTSIANVLDNLIADRRVPPVTGVFVDPRLRLDAPATNRRMTEYAMSDTFVNFLTEELRPFLATTYHIASAPARTGILGASMGGLISTYAALRRPEVFGLCAAQSPAYQIGKGTIFNFIKSGNAFGTRFYLETGTMHDAESMSRRMRDALVRAGFTVRYIEVPEGHNWKNWSGHLSDILTTFWGGM